MNDLIISKDTSLRKVMFSDRILERFQQALGTDQVKPYITSVLLAVANDEKLAECTPLSIISVALKCASMGLRVDPELREAYMVPFRDNKANVVKATLVIHYMGLHNMAVKTGLYRYINVGQVYEGQEVIKSFPSGFHTISGHKKSDVVIGWIGAFEMIKGFAKTVYWTIEEINAHRDRYSKSYQYNPKYSLWTTIPPVMQKKTIMRDLMGYAIKETSNAQMAMALSADESDLINVDELELIEAEVEQEDPHKDKSADDLIGELGFDNKAKNVTREDVKPVVKSIGIKDMKYCQADLPKSAKDYQNLYKFMGKFLIKEEIKAYVDDAPEKDAQKAFMKLVKSLKLVEVNDV